MAFAPYFGKAALSAASILRNFDYIAFQDQLLARCPVIAFDDAATRSPEARTTLELLVNLSARLYPRLRLATLGETTPQAESLCEQLVEAAKTINSSIEISAAVHGALPSDSETEPVVVVGSTPVPRTSSAVYVGSDEWTVATSCECPIGSGSSSNPFAAGIAACLGAAAVFRMVFGGSLPGTYAENSGSEQDNGGVTPLTDSPWRFSLLSMTAPDADAQTSAPLTRCEVDIGEVFLVGVGAIGNAAVWALARTTGISGHLHLVDPECVDLSNCQRYVLTAPQLVGTPKVEVAAAEFAARTAATISPTLLVEPHLQSWAEFATSDSLIRCDKAYKFDRVVLALDNARDRISAQASLPRWVLNSWTQPENLGVSRHPSFLEGPCVVCLYLPTGGRKSEDVLYAEALGAGPAELMEIRTRLFDRRPVGESFVRRVAGRFNVPYEALSAYSAQPIHALYTEALCGGIVLTLGGAYLSDVTVEVPMAFQSALAGILLAAELVIDAAALRLSPLPCRTEFNLLRPLTQHANVPAAKHPSGKCICQDDVYRAAFRRKYPGCLGDT